MYLHIRQTVILRSASLYVTTVQYFDRIHKLETKGQLKWASKFSTVNRHR